MNSLASTLDKFLGKRILVVGDLMLDSYMYGTAGRISPEAPVPVVDVRSQSMMLGGAGNVVANLAGLGCQASVVGVVGDDKDGAELISLLGNIGVSSCGVVVEKGRETTKKCRVIAGNQQVVRIDFENSNVLNKSTNDELRRVLIREIKGADGIIVSDYMKGVVSREIVEFILSLKDGRLTSVDPKDPSMNRYRGIDLIKPNLAAARRAVESEFSSSGFDLKNCGRILFDRLGCRYLLITLGADGMALFQSEERFRHFKTEVRRVFDVSGAGDTVLAAVTLPLVSGASVEESVRIGNLAAGIVVEKVGTATVSRNELIGREGNRGVERGLE
ncbi:MAG: hypothetical protein A3F16_06200 [Deltaproteobacteria bacterium RIFCSPHIGHO2_12_FULL_43_9]|nr:MAG: hypothetical protein A3F16_06200 [Deltaproteobacteria bacterium RIFCSPHIGHO2_12_FULL_43_9]